MKKRSVAEQENKQKKKSIFRLKWPSTMYENRCRPQYIIVKFQKHGYKDYVDLQRKKGRGVYKHTEKQRERVSYKISRLKMTVSHQRKILYGITHMRDLKK